MASLTRFYVLFCFCSGRTRDTFTSPIGTLVCVNVQHGSCLRVTFSGCFFYRPRRLSLVEHRPLASRRWVHHGTRCYIIKNMPSLDAEIVRDNMGNHEYVPEDRRSHGGIETNCLKDLRMALRSWNSEAHDERKNIEFSRPPIGVTHFLSAGRQVHFYRFSLASGRRSVSKSCRRPATCDDFERSARMRIAR